MLLILPCDGLVARPVAAGTGSSSPVTGIENGWMDVTNFSLFFAILCYILRNMLSHIIHFASNIGGFVFQVVTLCPF